jgi:hypothetical protein
LNKEIFVNRKSWSKLWNLKILLFNEKYVCWGILRSENQSWSDALFMIFLTKDISQPSVSAFSKKTFAGPANTIAYGIWDLASEDKYEDHRAHFFTEQLVRYWFVTSPDRDHRKTKRKIY